jgi:uncharacterized protein (TIGR00369 family)
MTDALPPEIERRVRESFARQGFMKKLGVSMDLVGRGVCELSTRHDETLTQQNGFFHAGVMAAIADSAAGYAALSMMPDNAAVLTTEFKLNLLTPAKGPRLLARGKVIKPGRTLFVVEANVYSGPIREETHVAVMLATEMCLMNRDDR